MPIRHAYNKIMATIVVNTRNYLIERYSKFKGGGGVTPVESIVTTD